MQIEILVLVDQFVLFDFLLTRIDHHIVRVVDDLLQIPQSEIEQIAHRTGQCLKEPYMGYGNR